MNPILLFISDNFNLNVEISKQWLDQVDRKTFLMSYFDVMIKFIEERVEEADDDSLLILKNHTSYDDVYFYILTSMLTKLSKEELDELFSLCKNCIYTNILETVKAKNYEAAISKKPAN